MKKILFSLLTILSVQCTNKIYVDKNDHMLSLDNSKLTQIKKSSFNEDEYSIIIELIEEYKTNHPSATEEEIANVVYNEYFNNTAGDFYVGGLSSDEFWIIFNGIGLDGFFEIKELADEVTDTTISYYGINGANDDSDAFRHIYLTACLYNNYNKNFAENLMSAHENSSVGISRDMDLHNNSRGIVLYEFWLENFDTVSLDSFISHCVKNGYIYNTKKINYNGNCLEYTNIGVNNYYYMEETIDTLTNVCISSTMKPNDFQWYKVSSGLSYGTYSVYSTGTTDVAVEIYSTISPNAEYFACDDDGNGIPNFNLEFTLNQYQTIYLKVFGYNNNKTGDYIIHLDETDVETETVTYIKHDKSTHKRISSIDGISYERHVVLAGSGRFTHCIYCNQSLDLNVDGPFIAQSRAQSQIINNANSFILPTNDLLKDNFEKES